MKRYFTGQYVDRHSGAHGVGVAFEDTTGDPQIGGHTGTSYFYGRTGAADANALIDALEAFGYAFAGTLDEQVAS